MSKIHITSAEVRTYRDRAGLTLDEMAAKLRVAPGKVRGWEDGTRRVPRHFAIPIRVVLDRLEREDALQAAGLPPCEWIEARLEVPETRAETRRRIAELNAHAAACPVCQARARYVREHLAHTLEPDSLAGRLFDWFYDLVTRIPLPLL